MSGIGNRECGWFGGVVKEEIGAQHGRDVNTEMCDFHTCVLLVGDPVHELVTNEALRPSLFSCKLGAGIIQCAAAVKLGLDQEGLSRAEQW